MAKSYCSSQRAPEGFPEASVDYSLLMSPWVGARAGFPGRLEHWNPGKLERWRHQTLGRLCIALVKRLSCELHELFRLLLASSDNLPGFQPSNLCLKVLCRLGAAA